MKIAAYVSDRGEVASLYSHGILRVFNEHGDSWDPEQDIALDIYDAMTSRELRVSLEEAIRQMPGCRVLLSGEVKGIPYAILGQLGIRVWKSEGALPDQLRYVARKEHANERVEAAAPLPLPKGAAKEGIYQINLSETLRNHPHLISKDVLIPFLEKRAFRMLEITCDHIPRWFDYEMARLGLRARSCPDVQCPGDILLQVTLLSPGELAAAGLPSMPQRCSRGCC